MRRIWWLFPAFKPFELFPDTGQGSTTAMVFDPSLGFALVPPVPPEATQGVLTGRNVEILVGIMDGLKVAEIATQVGLQGDLGSADGLIVI